MLFLRILIAFNCLDTIFLLILIWSVGCYKSILLLLWRNSIHWIRSLNNNWWTILWRWWILLTMIGLVCWRWWSGEEERLRGWRVLLILIIILCSSWMRIFTMCWWVRLWKNMEIDLFIKILRQWLLLRNITRLSRHCSIIR